MKWQLRLSEVELGHDERNAILEAIESSWITAGPRTAAFENAFAALCGTTEAVAVSNGTAALFLALKAAGVGPGDEVLCPSLTFVATAAAVVHCGAIPVFVDIRSLHNPTIDPLEAERAITPRTRALIAVHYAGTPCDMPELVDLCRTHGLTLIEDAAHAPGARYDGRPCGSFGLGCFSFFGNKNITTAEGGMITTNDRAVAERLRRLRSHGMTVQSWDRDRGRPADYDVLEFGYNFRLDDIRASVGLSQLKKLPQLNRKREDLAGYYSRCFQELNMNVEVPFRGTGKVKQPAYHIYPLVFRDPEERRLAEHALRASGIQTSLHYKPIHRFTALRGHDQKVRLPVTEAFADRELTLPLYPAMTRRDIDQVVDIVANSASRLALRH